MKVFYLLALMIPLMSSCDKRTLCSNPPATLTLAFVNENGDNMITNNELAENMFEFKKELGGNKNKTIPYDIDGNDHVVLRELELSNGIEQYKFLSTIHAFAFVVEGKNYEDCDGVYITEVLFRDVAYTQKDNYFQIKLIRK
ncbi:hypothetical protein [Sphingobacterium griseoflavum]|uniref:Uncharacterized protein n=1 Tax=Sphingobacterium griseoflavum TaxID=1474952 RepID=A0ABQ3HU17_9SPHI|nr:hypothetical protein [Sphingobacterium griseoflavum]GHE28821.1 hypothetical protein GCM10017764_09240 [Sphingobacterium griseoflavum]